MSDPTSPSIEEELDKIQMREVVQRNADGSEIHRVISLTDEAKQSIRALIDRTNTQARVEAVDEAESHICPGGTGNE